LNGSEVAEEVTKSQSTELSVTFWGVRGTLAAPGREFQRTGGNTICAEVRCGDRVIVLDAGTGIRELGTREPAGLGDLVAVDLGGAGIIRPGVVPEHQRARERPRLTAEVPDVVRAVADDDPGLLEHLASHRTFGRLPRLDEPGQGGEPARGPAPLTAEQGAVLAVAHQHDDGRVRPRKVQAAVVGAAPHPPGLDRVRRRPAPRAPLVGAQPVVQGDRSDHQARIAGIEHGSQLAQVGPPLFRTLGDVLREVRHIGSVDAEEGQFRIRVRAGGRLQVQPGSGRAHGDASGTVADEHQPRVRVRTSARQPIVVGPQVRGSIDDSAREQEIAQKLPIGVHVPRA